MPDATERRILETIDARRDDIIRFAEDIYRAPEAGFCELRTAARVEALFTSLGLPVERGLSVTGVRATLRGAAGAPTVCAVGELDGILCREHPFADRETGISHACGHHMQLAAVAGAAMALSDPGIRGALGGNVQFFAVPAEEYVPAATQDALRAAGRITASCGKSDLLLSGAFDGVGAAITTHAHMVPCQSDLLLGNNSCNGFIPKLVRFKGRAAHAAIAPQDGVNALDAAALAMSAIGMLRSTFCEADCVRVHGIVTKGGDAVNVVPEDVRAELQVRAKTLGAMRGVNAKVDRALRGAACALGAEVEITDRQGYLPVLPSPPCPALLDAARALEGQASFEPMDPAVHNVASTDVGDLSHLVPVVNFSYGGWTGTLHGPDFRITDAEKAYVLPAKLMALTVYHLLRDGAAQLRRLREGFSPALTAEAYRAYVQGCYRS